MSASILLVSDIFGTTDALLELVKLIEQNSIPVALITPYGHQNLSKQAPLYYFDNEQQAYDVFIKACGHTKYSDICHQAISSNKKNSTLKAKVQYIIAFSAGASAVWHAIREPFVQSQSADWLKETYFIGFYPSQIRNYTESTPAFLTQLLFPRIEEHFDVKAVATALQQANNTSCISTPYLHGFLNNQSLNYDQQAYQKFKRLISDKEVLSDPTLFHNKLTDAFSI